MPRSVWKVRCISVANVMSQRLISLVVKIAQHTLWMRVSMGVYLGEINQPVLFVIKVIRDGHISVKGERRIFFIPLIR